MAETYYPPLSEERCAAWMRGHLRPSPPPAPPPAFGLDDLDALIRAAEERARPRTQLPPHLNRFPLSWSPWLRRLVLTWHRRLFHDQRAVNTVLIQALRETLALNRHLLARLAERDAGGDSAAEDACGS